MNARAPNWIVMDHAPGRRAPVGCCIYCGESATSDEHIIALARRRALLLPDASCEDCAKITSAVEA